ncbi:MAG: AAA family ATPase, partial [Candidatus Paceibacterota bacterium]
MKILSIDIEKWRNLEKVNINVPEEESLICLVGENGTGKSNILELLSYACAELGLSSGYDLPRGNPSKDVHDFSLKIKLSPSIVNEVTKYFSEIYKNEGYVTEAQNWDGTLKFISANKENYQKEIIAGGNLEVIDKAAFGNEIKKVLRKIKEIYLVYLDSDRAYPPIKFDSRQIVEAEKKEFENWEWKNNWAYRPTRTLYEEWIKYFLAKERQVSTTHIKKIRKSQKQGKKAPNFKDPFESYTNSLQEILPHLEFSGIDDNENTISFDSSGTSLKFWQLSSGEKEISFLVGQIERFQLRKGIFLLDEPELHLNSDLVRLWVSYLQNTIDEGQVWLATHSLEAVEVAGN